VHADVQNLHLEVLRQFTLQHTEMTAMMDSLAARQDRIMAELLELKRAQQQQQVQRFN
jgi:protein NEDD1